MERRNACLTKKTETVKEKDVRFISPSRNKLLLSDSDRWSYNGVVFYGKRLYEYDLLDLIKNN